MTKFLSALFVSVFVTNLHAQVAVKSSTGNTDRTLLESIDKAVIDEVEGLGHAVIFGAPVESLFAQSKDKNPTAPEELSKIGKKLGAKIVMIVSVVDAGGDIAVLMRTVEVDGAAAHSLFRSTAAAEATATARGMTKELVPRKTPEQSALPVEEPSPQPSPVPNAVPAPETVPTVPAAAPTVPAAVPTVPAAPMVIFRPPFLYVSSDVDGTITSLDRKGGWFKTPYRFAIQSPGEHSVLVKKYGYSVGKAKLTLVDRDLEVKFKMGKTKKTIGLVFTLIGGITSVIALSVGGMSSGILEIWLPVTGVGLLFTGIGISFLATGKKTTYEITPR